MVFVQKARAGLADLLPSIFETRDAVFVERLGSSGAIEGAQHAIVPDCQCGERGYRKCEEPRRGAESEDDPGSERECGHDREPRVADARIEAGEARMFPRARRPPFSVCVEC